MKDTVIRSVGAQLTAPQRRYAERGTLLASALARIAARQWQGIPRSDFVSVGNEAVVRAALRFDDTRGVTFEVFARSAVWGAMLDFAHREVFVVQRMAARVAHSLATDGLADDPDEPWLTLLERPNAPQADAQASLRAHAAALVVAAMTAQAEALAVDETLIEAEQRAAMQLRVSRALGALTTEERELVRLAFQESNTLETVARLRGVSKRTVQRELGRVKARLAEALGDAHD